MTFRLLCCPVVAFVLSACDASPEWLQGRYEVDVVATMKSVAEEQPKAATTERPMENFLSNLLPLGAAFSGIDQTLEFTSGERLTTGPDGTRSGSYELVEKAEDSVVLRFGDGSLETWIRTPSGIAQTLPGDPPRLLHFKRVE